MKNDRLVRVSSEEIFDAEFGAVTKTFFTIWAANSDLPGIPPDEAEDIYRLLGKALEKYRHAIQAEKGGEA